MDDILPELKLDPTFATAFSNSDGILGDPLEEHTKFLDELFGTTPGAAAATASQATVPTMALSAVAGPPSPPSQEATIPHSATTVHAQVPARMPDAVPMASAHRDVPPMGTGEVATPATAAAPPQRASAGTSVAYPPPTTAPAMPIQAGHPRSSTMGGAEVAPRHGGPGPPTTVAPPQRETALYKAAFRRSHSLSAPTISSPSPRVSTHATTPSPLLPMPRYEPLPSTRHFDAPATSPATTSTTPAGLPAGSSSTPRALAPATVSKPDTRKRARADDDAEAYGDSRRNTDVPAKRPAMAEAWQARSALDVPLAQSSAPVGHHVQSHNNTLPQAPSHAPSVDGELTEPSAEEDGALIVDEYTRMFDEVEVPDDATAGEADDEDDSDAGSLFDEDGSTLAPPQAPSLALPGGGLQLPGGSAGPVLDGAALMGLTARDAAIRAARPAPRPKAPAQAPAQPVAGPSQPAPLPPPPSPPQTSGKKKKARAQARVRGQASKPAGPTPAKEETPEQKRLRKANSNAVALREAIGTRYPWMMEDAAAGPASTSAPAAAGPSNAAPQPAAPVGTTAAPSIAPSTILRAAPNPGTYEQRAAKDPKAKNPTTGPAPLTKSRYCDICWQRRKNSIWFNDEGLRDHLRKATSPGHPNAKST